MGYLIHAFLFGWNLLYCDATVTVSLINSANGDDTLECRSDGVVSCRINPYAGLINWVIDGTFYAMCSTGCSENPSFSRNYSPEYDEANGVFNLTVDSATYNDNSTTFKCDDGTLVDDITIEVVPAYSENKTSINETNEGKQVEFTSACVQPGVEFYWFTVKTDDSDMERYNYGQNENNKTGECSLDSHCGGVGTVNVASVVMIPTVPNLVPKEERYLGVVVKYKNPDGERTFRFNEIFHFKDCKMLCLLTIVLIYSIRWILLLVSFFAGYSCDLWKISWRNCVLVFIGYIPILGQCCSAFFLFHKEKEMKSLIKWTFIVSWFCDSCLFVVMMFTCTDIIKEQCLIYAVYGSITSIFPLIPFGCLVKDLQKQKGNNTTGKELDVGCGICKQQTKQITENKCENCGKYVCKKCRQKHTKEQCVKDKREKGNNTTGKELDVGCGICKQQTKQITENKCENCGKYVCKKCRQEHTNDQCAKDMREKDNTTDKELKVLCGICKQQTKQIPENKCENCGKYICKKCRQEHTKDRCAKDMSEKDKCMCYCRRNNSESYCLSCHQYLCKECITNHVKHKIIGHCKKDKNRNKCSRSRDNAESYCLTCEQYLCKWCVTNHAEHGVLGHCQQEAGESRCQIFCMLCENNDIKTNTKYYNSADESLIVCEDCKSKRGLQDIIAMDDLYFHSENNVESYCLSCQQYLCSLCFTKHAEHRILRHSQGADEAPPQIFCKYCQNKGIQADAEFYNKDDKSFFCKVCKVLKHMQDITAVKGVHEWICQQCKETPVECKNMSNQTKLCVACFEHKMIDEGKTNEFCAFHSGLFVKMNDANELPTDVVCLVCDEYLCKMCFKQHLNLKQRWLQQYPDEENLDKKISKITILLLRPVKKRAEKKYLHSLEREIHHVYYIVDNSQMSMKFPKQLDSSKM